MYLEDIRLGEVKTVENIVIDKDEMIDFARRYNPARIHTDEDFARKTRFGKLIAPGMLSFLSVWAQYVSLDFAGDDLVAGKSTAVEWLKPVFAGDTLKGVAKITKLEEKSTHTGIMTVTIDVYNQDGDNVLTSVIESIVKRRPTE